MHIEVNANSMEDAIRNMGGIVNNNLGNAVNNITVTIGDESMLASMLNDNVGNIHDLQYNGYTFVKDNTNYDYDRYSAYIINGNGNNSDSSESDSESITATQKVRITHCFGDIIANNKIGKINSIDAIGESEKQWIIGAYADIKATELYSMCFESSDKTEQYKQFVDDVLFEIVVGNYNRWETTDEFMSNILKIAANLKAIGSSIYERQQGLYTKEKSHDDTKRFGRALERKVLLVDLDEQISFIIDNIDSDTVDKYSFVKFNRLISRITKMIESEKTDGEARISLLVNTMSTRKLIKELEKED